MESNLVGPVTDAEIEAANEEQFMADRLLVDQNLDKLDELKSTTEFKQALYDEKLIKLLGDNYPQYLILQKQQKDLSSDYSGQVKDLRLEVDRFVLAHDMELSGRFFRFSIPVSKPKLDEVALLEWAEENGHSETIKGFYKDPVPSVRMNKIKS